MTAGFGGLAEKGNTKKAKAIRRYVRVAVINARADLNFAAA